MYQLNISLLYVSFIEQSMHDQSRVMGQALLSFSPPPLYLALVCTVQVGTHCILHSRQRDGVKSERKNLPVPLPSTT